MHMAYTSHVYTIQRSLRIHLTSMMECPDIPGYHHVQPPWMVKQHVSPHCSPQDTCDDFFGWDSWDLNGMKSPKIYETSSALWLKHTKNMAGKTATCKVPQLQTTNASPGSFLRAQAICSKSPAICLEKNRISGWQQENKREYVNCKCVFCSYYVFNFSL